MAGQVKSGRSSKKLRLEGSKRKTQLIECAFRLFAEKGFNGTTTKEISELAGVSEALLFKFFPDKKSLYQAIIGYQMKRTFEMSHFIKKEEETFNHYFHRIATMYIEMIERDDSFMRILLYSSLEGHELSQLFFKERVSKVDSLIAGEIKKGVSSGELTTGDPVISSRLFVGMIFNYLLAKRIMKDRVAASWPREKIISSMVETFMRGIGKNNKKVRG